MLAFGHVKKGSSIGAMNAWKEGGTHVVSTVAVDLARVDVDRASSLHVDEDASSLPGEESDRIWTCQGTLIHRGDG